MSRFIDTFIKLYNIYYDNIYNNISYYNRIKYKNVYSDKSYKQINNIISAFNDNHIFDNYCCFCLNYKRNDLFIKLNCEHEMHYYCFNNYIKLKYNHCPFCKILINDTNNNINNDTNNNINNDTNNNINNDKLYKYEIKELYYI